MKILKKFYNISFCFFNIYMFKFIVLCICKDIFYAYLRTFLIKKIFNHTETNFLNNLNIIINNNMLLMSYVLRSMAV